MNFKKTLILGAILAALVAYISEVQIPKDEVENKKAQIFSAVKREELSSVEIVNSNGAVLLKNSAAKPAQSGEKNEALDPAWDKHWSIEGLAGGRLDAGALNTLISAVLDLNLDKPLPAEDRESDLSVYGLDKPVVTVKVGAGTQNFEVKFGKINEYLSKRYVALGGTADVYMIADSLFLQASKTRDDFRDRTPIEFADSALKSLELKDFTGSRSFILEQGDSSKWSIAEPFKALANASSVNSYTTQLRNLSATEFIDNQQTDLANFGLDKPKLKVTLNFKDEKRSAINALYGEVQSAEGKGASDGYLMIDGTPVIYKLAGSAMKELLKDGASFREKKLFQFADSEVSQIEVEQSGKVLTISKTADKWSVNGKDADETFVEAYLKKLSDLEAKDFPSTTNKFGFDTPQLKVLVRLAERGGADKGKSERSRTLVVGGVAKSEAGKPSEYYAGVDDLSSPFTISNESLAHITPKEDALVKAVATAAPLLTPPSSATATKN